MKIQNLSVPALAIVTLLAVACSSSAPASPPQTPVPGNPPGAPPAVASVATTAPTAVPATPGSPAFTLADSVGRTVTLAGVPARIVSLAPSTTEIAFAIGAGGRIVGVDEYSDYPDAAKSLAKVTKGFNYNYEQIVSLKPDLVLAAGITSADVVKKLEDLKLTVLVVGAPTTTFDSVKNDITLEGKALGAGDQASRVISNMDQKIASVNAAIAQAKTRPRVYWELDSTDPSKPYAPGPGSFLDDLIALAGGENVTHSAKQAYAQVSAEEIISDNPEIIVLSDAAYGTSPDSVKARPGWAGIAAVKTGKVFPIDDNLVSRPGPRLADGFEAAAKLIHPELFP